METRILSDGTIITIASDMNRYVVSKARFSKTLHDAVLERNKRAVLDWLGSPVNMTGDVVYGAIDLDMEMMADMLSLYDSIPLGGLQGD